MLKPKATYHAIEQSGEFRHALRSWFAQYGNDYPWRRTQDPYAILVSEMMLQQTRLAVVLGKGYYTRFMEQFPDVFSLARAGESELLRVWEGLGYYRRARLLQAAAKHVVENHKGIFPNEINDLLVLPGIGAYTAGALRSFAFDLPAPLVDGNVMRVFSRMFDDHTPIDTTPAIKSAWTRAELLLDPQYPRIYNSALMELGQKICRVGMPDCWQCPVSSFCHSKEPELLPMKAKKTNITAVDEQVIVARDPQGQLLLFCESGKRREGLWRLPERSRDEVQGLHLLHELTYTITRYRVQLAAYACENPTLRPGETWVAAEQWESLPMAAPYRKMIRHLLA